MGDPEAKSLDEKVPANVASGSNPSPLARAITSRMARAWGSPTRRRIHYGAIERLRKLRGNRRRLGYFHEVDDPYSHLAAQAIAELLRRYDIDLFPFVCARDDGINRPEPELLRDYARRDAASVAPDYGLRFTDPGAPPDPGLVRRGEAVLAAASSPERFATLVVRVGDAVWAGDEEAMRSLESECPPLADDATKARLAEGAAFREQQRHYSGGMFGFQGGWYWGVDRLHLLEARLIAEGAATTDEGIAFARPALTMQTGTNSAEITLEYFPSLRSPYTAVAHPQTLELAERTGVHLEVRPVLPMVMRGVPVTLAKGLYIFEDARREAEHAGIPFGRMHDPIGPPTERGFALWVHARERGCGNALLSSFLSGAFAEGIPVSTEAGLRKVVERAGLSWADAQAALAAPDDGWRSVLEENRQRMYGLGLWGVPSYRVSGPGDEPAFSCWGNDRLWKVSREIARRLDTPSA